MHELAISEAIIAEVCEHIGGAAVRRVVIEVGRLSSVVPDAVRFCFDLAARHTPLDGAVLEIAEIPGKGRCNKCAAETPLHDSFSTACSGCGEIGLEITSGNELRIQCVEVI